jgi:hypothetical protein
MTATVCNHDGMKRRISRSKNEDCVATLPVKRHPPLQPSRSSSGWPLFDCAAAASASQCPQLPSQQTCLQSPVRPPAGCAALPAQPEDRKVQHIRQQSSCEDAWVQNGSSFRYSKDLTATTAYRWACPASWVCQATMRMMLTRQSAQIQRSTPAGQSTATIHVAM